MSLVVGKNAIQSLFNYTPRRGWGYELKNLRGKIVDAFRTRCEILDGGIVTDGTATATELMLNMTAMKVTLNGRLMTFAAVTDDDFLDTSTVGVGQPIYQDGSDASALSLGTDESAYVTLIVTSSDDAGGDDDDDNGACLVVAVVAGTALTYAAQTEHVTSAEIQAALEASTTMHDGVTAWAHVCQLVYADTGGAAWAATVVMNRNNVVSEA